MYANFYTFVGGLGLSMDQNSGKFLHECIVSSQHCGD